MKTKFETPEDGTFQIEHGIPIPSKLRITGFTEALKKCAVSDSFVMPKDTNRNGLYVAAKRIGMKVALRVLPDKSIRVWRME